MDNLLEVKALKKYFPIIRGLVLAQTVGWIKAVDGVDFGVKRGQTLGLVGESGSGKTTIAKLILLLEKPTSGRILFGDRDVATLQGKELKAYRCSVQPVFQDPMSSLNPRLKIGEIISEPLEVNSVFPRKDIKARVAEVLELVGLPADSARLLPHEFSGGQRQRVAIARAIAPNPSLVILDEPVSALDVSIRAQVINLLKGLQESLGHSYILIGHDLAVVAYMSDQIGVIYLGRIMEIAKGEELFAHPLHPYTQALFSAALPYQPGETTTPLRLSGEIPSPINLPRGCRFRTRCLHTKPLCSEEEPTLAEVEPQHQVACYLCG